MMTYHERNQCVLACLHPVTAARVSRLLEYLEAFGEDVLLTSGKRSEEEQNDLWASGRTKPGRIVTHVKGRESFHYWGVAFDLVPVLFFIPIWNSHKRYDAIARIALALGFQWGFQMWGFDKPHFQYTQGLSIEDFYMGKSPKPEPLHELEVPSPENLRQRSIVRGLSRFFGRIGIRVFTRQ